MSQSHSVNHCDVGSPERGRTAVEQWAWRRVEALLAPAGIVLDGAHSCDPRIHHPRALRRVLMTGTLGAGESYMDADWDCDAIDEFIARLLAADADRRLPPHES